LRLLVTGAAGFIGSNFCRFVLGNSSHDLVGLDLMTYAANEASVTDLIGPRFSFIKGDILDKALLHQLVEDCDVVVHFAAESHNDNSLWDPSVFLKTNIEGTFSVIQAVLKFNKRLHHVSTDEVFGDLPLRGTSKFSEKTKYNPSSPYSASKASSDMLVRAWIRSFGLRATISNCSNNYGPRQHVEKFIPRQITQVLRGEKPVLYGSGLNVRDWIHVDDHSDAILRIIENAPSGETFLIGVNGEKSNLEVLQMILLAMGKPHDWYVSIPDRPGHDRRYSIDSSKLKTRLGWPSQPTKNFERGIRETIDWYDLNHLWWKKAKSDSERRYREMEREI